MKKFGLIENAFLFPIKIGKEQAYKLHIPMSASAEQADHLIAEAERQIKGITQTLVVEFPSRIFRGFIPNQSDFPSLRKYYTMPEGEYQNLYSRYKT